MVCLRSDLLSVNIYGRESLRAYSEARLAEQRAVETCGRCRAQTQNNPDSGFAVDSAGCQSRESSLNTAHRLILEAASRPAAQPPLTKGFFFFYGL